MARDWKEYLRSQEIKVVLIGYVKPYPNNPRDNEKAVPAVGISFVLPRKNKTKNYFRPGRKRVDLVLFFCAPFRGAEKSKLIRVRPSENQRSGRGATGRPPESGNNGSGRARWDVTSLRGHGSSPPPLEGRAREGAALQGRLSFRRRNFSRRRKCQQNQRK